MSIGGVETEASDRALLDRLRAGDEEAAAAVYRRYAPRLTALVRARRPSELADRLDAEDLVQSAFGRFFLGAGRGRFDVPEGPGRLWGLLRGITRNTVRATRAHHRAARRDARRTGRADGLGHLPDRVDVPGHALRCLARDEVLSRLAPLVRRVVELRAEGHGVGEVARLTGRSRRTVERLLGEARRDLAELLRDGD